MKSKAYSFQVIFTGWGTILLFYELNYIVSRLRSVFGRKNGADVKAFSLGTMLFRSRIHLGFGGYICVCAVLIGLTVPLSSSGSLAQEVEERSRIGDWSIYCVKNSKPNIQDCSLVTAAEGDNDPAVWVRLGFAFVSPAGDTTMTVRTPRLNYFRKGVSISTDGKQLGKLFIDECSENACETTVRVDPRLLRGLATAEVASFEYQVSDVEGVAIAIRFNQFIEGLGELQKVTGLGSGTGMGEASDRINNRNAPKVYGFVGKRGDTRIKVELRTNPYTALEAKGWGEPLKDCFGAPPAKEVIVSSDLKIRDSQKFEEWLSSSLPCAENAVFWITIAKPSRATANLGETPLDQVSKYAVYERVKDKVPVPYVVTMDNSGRIPIQFPKQ